MGSTGRCSTCKKDNLFVEANSFDADGYAIDSDRSGTSGITSGWHVIRSVLRLYAHNGRRSGRDERDVVLAQGVVERNDILR